MKYLKPLASTAVIGVTMLVAVASASATGLYSGATGLGAGTTITASLSGTATLTTTEGTVLDTCSGGEVKGKTSNAGGATETVKGNIEALTWTNCTEPTTTLSKGGLEIHYTSGLNGTVTAISSNFGAASEVTVNTTIFGSCVFTIATGGTIGTLTGSTTTNAMFDINAVATRKSGLCPSSAKWVGTYKVTSPNPLHVTADSSGGGGGEEGLALRTTPNSAFNFFVGFDQTKSLTLEGSSAESVTVTSGALEASGGGSPPAGLDFQSWGCFNDITYSTGLGTTCTLTLKNTSSTPKGTYYLHIRGDQGGKTRDKYISIIVS